MFKIHYIIIINIVAIFYVVYNAYIEHAYPIRTKPISPTYKYVYNQSCNLDKSTPVCGVDSKIYANACVAQSHGVTKFQPIDVCNVRNDFQKYCQKVQQNSHLRLQAIDDNSAV